MPVRTTFARKNVRRRFVAPPLPPSYSPDLGGASTAYGRNEEIFGEGEPAGCIYKVLAGSVRTYTTLNDGRRQIGAFYLPGDVFGLEARKLHNVSAEAITRSKIQVGRKAELHFLLELTTEELQRTQDHIVLLLKSAQERVISFLLDMAKREDAQIEIELPMSRQDIADYLGLTIETVSRTLTRLESTAIISLPTSRRVIVRDRRALLALLA